MGTNEKRRRTNLKQAIILVALLIVGIGGVMLYYERESETQYISATFKKVDGTLTPELKLELAINTNQRTKGLMWRKSGSMKENEGMLFIFPDVIDRIFWMENTYLSLDMLFLTPDRRVAGIIENVPPLTRDKRSIGTPTSIVVELVAGSAKRLGITKGAELSPVGALPTPR